MSKSVILREMIGRMQSFNLPHATFCVPRGKCSCSMVVLRLAVPDKRTGVRRVREVHTVAPKSITLLPRQEHEPLPAEVLQCNEIISALKARPPRISYREA